MNHRSFETLRRGAWSAAFAALAAVALVWTPTQVEAQTGTIVGTVTEANSQRPLESVQVFIEGTGIGTLTNSSGRYLLVNVPAGEHTVQAELVGYRAVTQTVTVEAGESAVADLELSQQAVALDQIVVSGAGVATEKKRLGNTIATINTEGIENAPITNFSDLLQGREPSLVSLPSSGTTGEGSRIRIRGSASLSQSNEPIIYVDGIRVDNGGGFGAGVSAGGQGQPSRLDDIDPTSIERIEVLKGAAAATLYGTEASSGVIQIFTKRGQQGEPRWTLQTDQNVIDVPQNRFIPHADFARNQEQVQNVRDAFGLDVQPFEPFEVSIMPEVLETGRSQTYSGSVQGGGELITYFASGRYQNENGVFVGDIRGEDLPVTDRNVRRQATTNLNIFPTDDLRIRVSGLYSEQNLTSLNNANNIFGFFSSMFMAQPRLAQAQGGQNGFFGAPAFGTTLEFGQVEVTQDNEHFAGSINANWALPDVGLPGQFVIDGTFGVDVTNTQSVEFGPFGHNVDNFTTNFTEGFRNLNDRNRREVTGDFKLNHEVDLFEGLSSSFVFGAQGFIRQFLTSGGDGQNFPGPGLETVGSAADQSIFEIFLREVNTGIFFQEQFGWNDFAFLTVGGRWDKNSAFGESAGTEFYPKVSGSVVLSDSPWWPQNDLVSQFRVRAAVGQSGLQPGAFDQFTTFSALPSSEGAGVQPDNLGNDALKPETSTEWEVGAEVEFFNGRAGVDFTYWDREVDDALVARQFPVTGGFRNTQLDNIGLVEARGIEIAVNGTVYEGRDTEVRLFANASWIDEEVSDLGLAPPLKTGGSYPRYRNFIKEDFAPGAFFGADISDVDIPLNLAGDCSVPSRQQALDFFSQPRNPNDFEVLSKTVEGAPGGPGCPGDFLGNFLGKPTPDWQGSFGMDFTFLSNFEVSTLFEYKFGNFQVQDLSGAFRQANAVIGRNTPGSNRVNAIMQNPNSTAEERLDAAIEWAREYRALAPMSGMNQIWDAAFLRFREFNLTYRVPGEFVESLMLNNATVTFGVRNLWLFVNDQFRGLDPEINVLGRCGGDGTAADLDCQFLNSVEGWGVPIPRRFTFSLRVGF